MEDNIKQAVAIATQFAETNQKVQTAKNAVSALMFVGSEFLNERQKEALKAAQVIIHEIGVASSQTAAEKFALENMTVSV